MSGGWPASTAVAIGGADVRHGSKQPLRGAARRAAAHVVAVLVLIGGLATLKAPHSAGTKAQQLPMDGGSSSPHQMHQALMETQPDLNGRIASNAVFASEERAPLPLTPLPRGQSNSHVAMCLSAKAEHCDIREWVLHHASLGVGKFYIFDTASQPPMQPVLEDFIATGLVDYFYLQSNDSEAQAAGNRSQAGEGQQGQQPQQPYGKKYQLDVYQLCLEHFGRRHRWMAFIDADEFIILQPGLDSLPQLLQQYEQYSGLLLHWQLFASNAYI